MFQQKYNSIQEYDISAVKNEYEYLFHKDGESKGDDITDENEVFVEYGKDFINCKRIHSKQ